MKFFICVLLLAVILAGGLCACDGNTTLDTTVTPTVKFKIEQVGKWDFSTPPGWDTQPDFVSPSEEGLVDPVTYETARIGGEDYFLLNFPASSGDDNSHVFIFDTQDPLSPELVSIMAPEKAAKNGYQINTTAVEGNIYYGGLFLDNGLWMADISDPANPKDLGIAPLGMTREMVASGGYVYGMSQMNFDLPVGYAGDIQNAREVARIETGSRDCQLAISGHLLFTGLDNKLTVYDITDPASPQKLGVCELALGGGLITDVPYDQGVYDWANWANIFDIKASGDYVYAAFGAGQVRVIDVSDPESKGSRRRQYRRLCYSSDAER
jgi:hypothetical protein